MHVICYFLYLINIDYTRDTYLYLLIKDKTWNYRIVRNNEMLVVARLFHLTEKVLHQFLKSGQQSLHGRQHNLGQYSGFPWEEYTGQTFEYIGKYLLWIDIFPYGEERKSKSYDSESQGNFRGSRSQKIVRLFYKAPPQYYKI